MLSNFIFFMISAGFLSLLLSTRRIKTLWSLILLCVMLCSIFSILHPYSGNAISFLWKAIPHLPVAIELNPWQSGKLSIFGVLILHTISIYYNSISQHEQNPNIISGLMLFNCVFIIMAFCSVNYIQFLAAVGMADVVVYSIINNLDAKRYYIYGNFIADFIFLNILALILGQQGKIDITHLEEYTRSWHHRDFISIMLLIAIFIKSGLAFFHVTYQKMSALSFNRLNFILFASTPLMGLISLLLLHNILTISHYSESLLKIFSVLTIIWGFLGYVTTDSLKRKASYNSMLFWGLSYAAYIWLPNFSHNNFFVFLIAAYLFNFSLKIIYKNSGEETSIEIISETAICSKALFIVVLMSIALYLVTWQHFSAENTILSIVGLIAIILTTSQTMSEIYLKQEGTTSKTSVESLTLLSLPIAIFFAIFMLNNYHSASSLVFPLVVLMLWTITFLVYPLHFLKQGHGIDFIQNGDASTFLYSTIILKPIQFIGRGLRVAVDFILLERTIIASIKNSIRFFIFMFKGLHNDKIWGKLIFIIFGIILFVATYYSGVEK